MNRPLFIGLLAAIAAWTLIRQRQQSSTQVVPVQEAAARLQQAWADHHTTA